MGKEHEIIVREKVAVTDRADTGATVTLAARGGRGFDKKLPTIARNLVERLLRTSSRRATPARTSSLASRTAPARSA